MSNTTKYTKIKHIFTLESSEPNSINTIDIELIKKILEARRVNAFYILLYDVNPKDLSLILTEEITCYIDRLEESGFIKYVEDLDLASYTSYDYYKEHLEWL